VQADNKTSPDISVVIPLFNEKESLEPFYDRLRDVLASMGKSHEILFVDDGSTDGSADVLISLKEKTPAIRIVQLQKNCGKSAALASGFALARGASVVTLDADLQDDPREIPRLLKKLDEGYDLVSGWKKNRRDPLSKRIPSKVWNIMTSLITGAHLHDHNCGLKAYRRKVVSAVPLYGELHRYIPALAAGYGFTIAEIPVKHFPRQYGKTKYGMWRFFSGFFDLLTVMFLTRFTQSPLHLFGIAGLLFFAVGFCISLYLTIIKYVYNVGIGNRPLLFLGILLIIVGFQFFSLGFLGEMIANFRNQDREQVIKKIYE